MKNPLNPEGNKVSKLNENFFSLMTIFSKSAKILPRLMTGQMHRSSEWIQLLQCTAAVQCTAGALQVHCSAPQCTSAPKTSCLAGNVHMFVTHFALAVRALRTRTLRQSDPMVPRHEPHHTEPGCLTNLPQARHRLCKVIPATIWVNLPTYVE